MPFFGLELLMQVELLKRDKNDDIETMEQCIAAACEIHGDYNMPRRVVQNFYGYEILTPSRLWPGRGLPCDGVPKDFDSMRYAGYGSSHFQGNVQFDRHNTELVDAFQRTRNTWHHCHKDSPGREKHSVCSLEDYSGCSPGPEKAE